MSTDKKEDKDDSGFEIIRKPRRCDGVNAFQERCNTIVFVRSQPKGYSGPVFCNKCKYQNHPRGR